MERRRLVLPVAVIVQDDIPKVAIAWKNMIWRCYNPRAHNWANYGGRGIAVCLRWHTFGNFLQDMGTPARPELSLDRYPDNNGNYELSNCRWATQRQQARNVRTNVHLTHNGKTQTMVEWADELGITRHALWTRLRHHKIPLDLALSAVGDARNPRYNRKERIVVLYNEVPTFLKEACRLKGVNYQTIIQRAWRGKLTHQEAFDW